MKTNKLLEGITIIDFSHRLPGPMAGHVLSMFGAKVIKVEDHKFKDAFLQGLFSEFDPSFKEWYKELNQHKELQRFDFKSQEDQQKMLELIRNADAVIMGLPPKIRNAMGLTQEAMETWDQPLAVIEIGSTEVEELNKQSMHDLNAMALTGILSLYVADKEGDRVNPPFLPVSGIGLGQHTASALMAAILRSQKTGKPVFTQTFLYETARDIFAPFWPKACRDEKMVSFLHNGAFPCYNLYRTADNHYLAVAAVEAKFWQGVLDTFEIDLPMENRFDTNPEAYQKVIDVFSNLTTDEIKTKMGAQDLCLSIIEKF